MSTGLIAIRQTLTATFDGSGNASVRIAPQDIPMNRVAVIRFDLFGSVGAPSFTLIGNGIQLDACIGYATLGPANIDNNYLPVSVVATGGTPGAQVSLTLSGWTASDPTQLPDMPGASNVSIVGGSVAITGPVSITGPVTVNQSDPSQLLAGQVGVPLIENGSGTIPANSVDLPFPSAVTVYDVAGFGAVYLSGLVGGGVNAAVHFQVEWLDGGGNTIDVTGVPNCCQAFQIVIGTNARFMRVHFWNIDIVSHALTKFTIIPLVSLPNPQGSVLSSILGNVSAAPNPDPRSMMATDNQPIAASGTFTDDAFFTYAGPAIWNPSNSAGATNTSWWAELRVKFANGTLQSIAHAGGVAVQPGQQVVLPAGHMQALLHNTAAASANFDNSLIAV